MFALSNDDEVKITCFWIISELSKQETREIIDEIIKSDLLLNICKNYQVESGTIIPAIRIIGNMASNEDFYVEYLLKIDVLSFFRKILPFDNDCSIKEMFWAISNLTATCRNAIMIFLEDDLIIPLCKKLLKSHKTFIKEEAFIFLGGIAANADSVIGRKIIDWRLDEDIISVLKETKNPDLLKMIFQIIDQLIKLNVFTKKGQKGQQLHNGNIDKGDFSSYSRIKSPFIDSFIKKGILDILDILTSHGHQEVATVAVDIIGNLKDDS